MSDKQLTLLGMPEPEPAPKKKPRRSAAQSARKPDPAGKRAESRATSADAPSGDRPTLYLVDGPNIAFRAHYAPMAGLTNAEGFPTKALFGYCNMLFKLFRERRPDFLVLCWDPRGGTFRNDIYEEYKGTRPDMPDELRVQLDRFPEVADALGLCHYVKPGYEADDVIGTLAERHKETHDVVIVSGDKDLMALVDTTRVTMLDTMKDVVIGPEQVEQRWGVPPERLIDVLALMGDSSDNIPGVAGIGKKGASQLIAQWGPIENLFDHVDEVKGRGRKPLLAEGAKEVALLSKKLATIDLDVDVPLTLGDMEFVWPPTDLPPVTALFTELEFHRFLDEIGGEMKALTADRYRLVLDLLDLRQLIEALRGHDEIALEVVTDSPDAKRSRLLGVGLCVHASEAWYVPLDHDAVEGSLEADRALLYLRAILESPAKRLICPDAQFAWTVLARHGVTMGAIGGDCSVASFLLNSERRTHELSGIALTWLQHKMDPRTGGLADLDADALRRVGPEGAHVTWLLREQLHDALQRGEVFDVYRGIDLPLIPVLCQIEAAGFKIDLDKLNAYGEELRVEAAAAEAETWKHAGREFNSASPKQLAEILFVELGLPIIKRTKTGPSTDASVLEELAKEHPLPAAILRFRSVTKLLSTYVDAFVPLVDPETGRIHTRFSQTVAATGRLSSRDPNLQNIPIRTAEGRRIRESFIAEPGHVLLSADYSQIELRVLAHLCGGTGGFARAFADGEDVHRITAAEVFGTTPAEVTSEQRSAAKAVNFGLVYGQTDFGLSRSLHIPRAEAKEYIARYKEKFPEIDRFMEETVTEAKATRYVRTITGRRRPVADLTSNNYNARMAARRVAINTPVQGTAADIIKLAMLRVMRLLDEQFPDVRLILQVHDELVFEVPTAQVDRLAAAVVQEMEAAYPLSVPLVVDTGTGRTWEEAH